MIYTSSPILVRADTSIAECVRLMKENNVGSVLIVTDDHEQTLVGIFTERDLLKKIDLVHQGGHWLNPVRTVMTSPVMTLDVNKIENAPKLMLQGRFRHIPIVSKAEGKERVVGIVSMRDLFTHLVVQHEKQARANKDKATEKPTFNLVTLDDSFASFVEKVFPTLMSAKVKRIKPDADYGKKLCTMIFDIDGFKQDMWPNRLAQMSRDPLIRLIIVAYEPNLHPPEIMKVLDRLGSSPKFWIFKKPIEVFELLNLLAD